MIRQTLRFHPGGRVTGFYSEAIDLKSLGKLRVVRATDITFNADTQQWDVRRTGTPAVLFSHPSRDACINWELANLRPEDERAVET